MVLAFLCDAYDEEVVDAEKNDTRVVLRLHPALAPFKAAVLPLSKKLSDGAKEVYACATHGVLSGPALQRLTDSVITETVFLDTIPAKEGSEAARIKMLSVAPVFAEAISRIYEDKPVSPLFT